MRLVVFDNIRGIGILVVVLGHVWIAPDFVKKIIYLFHMPMFFILSGYLFNTEKNLATSFGSFFGRRTKRLYLPALFIGFSCAVPSILSGRVEGFEVFLKNSFGVIYGIPNYKWSFNSSPIWFLSCLLCVESYFFIIKKYAPKRTLVSVLLAFSIGVLMSREVSFYSPLNSHVALVALMFFYLGNLLSEKKYVENHHPSRFYFVCGLVGLLLLPFLRESSVGMASNNLGDINYLFLGVLCGSYIVLCVAKWCENFRVFGYLGRHTILILGYNYWAFEIVHRSFLKMNLPYNWVINFGAQVCLFLVASFLIDRIPILDRLIQGNQKVSSATKLK